MSIESLIEKHVLLDSNIRELCIELGTYCREEARLRPRDERWLFRIGQFQKEVNQLNFGYDIYLVPLHTTEFRGKCYMLAGATVLGFSLGILYGTVNDAPLFLTASVGTLIGCMAGGILCRNSPMDVTGYIKWIRDQQAILQRAIEKLTELKTRLILASPNIDDESASYIIALCEKSFLL